MLTFRKLSRKAPAKYGLSEILVEVGRLQHKLSHPPRTVSKTAVRQAKASFRPLHRQAETLRLKYVLGKGVTSAETSSLQVKLKAFVSKYSR